nr:hypothetical protein [Mycobacterium lepromatosis]
MFPFGLVSLTLIVIYVVVQYDAYVDSPRHWYHSRRGGYLPIVVSPLCPALMPVALATPTRDMRILAQPCRRHSDYRHFTADAGNRRRPQQA